MVGLEGSLASCSPSIDDQKTAAFACFVLVVGFSWDSLLKQRFGQPSWKTWKGIPIVEVSRQGGRLKRPSLHDSLLGALETFLEW